MEFTVNGESADMDTVLNSGDQIFAVPRKYQSISAGVPDGEIERNETENRKNLKMKKIPKTSNIHDILREVEQNLQKETDNCYCK